MQTLHHIQINFWRTKGGAEVDFILSQYTNLLPIEVKYQNMNVPSISRGFRSFLEAYRPENAVYLTKDLMDEVVVAGCRVYFIPITQLGNLFKLVEKIFFH